MEDFALRFVGIFLLVGGVPPRNQLFNHGALRHFIAICNENKTITDY